jgi:hypothetical protein
MANKAQIETTGKKARITLANTRAVSGPDDNHWDADSGDNVDFDERWLTLAAKGKERSRIQRQMKARRELERRRDEKRLRDLVEDWPF